MTDDVKNEHTAKSARNERLKSALSDNLKRRKLQARGRAGMAIVTPDDDVRARDDASGVGSNRRDGDH